MKQYNMDEEYTALIERRISEEGNKRLAKAMISRAVRDLREPNYSNCAREWIFRTTGQVGGISFEQCCETLGFRPENIRGRIFEGYNDKENNPLN